MAPKNNTIDITINTEPGLTSLVNFVNRKKAGNSADFNIPTISEREVLEIVKSAPSNAATRLDGTSSPLLKLIAPAAAPSLAKVINCSIINSICPAQLKLARPPCHFEDSRETCLQTLLIAFLTYHDLLYKCQSGFRANYSCETILIKITYACRLEAMDNGLFTGVVMICAKLSTL